MYGCRDEAGNFSHYICTRKVCDMITQYHAPVSVRIKL